MKLKPKMILTRSRKEDWDTPLLNFSMDYWERLFHKSKHWKERQKLRRWINDCQAELLARKLSE